MQHISEKRQKLADKIIKDLLIPRFETMMQVHRLLESSSQNTHNNIISQNLENYKRTMLVHYTRSIETEILRNIGITLTGEKVHVKILEPQSGIVSMITSVNKSLVDIYNITQQAIAADDTLITMRNDINALSYPKLNYDILRVIIKNTEAFQNLISDILPQKQKGFTHNLREEVKAMSRDELDNILGYRSL